MLFTTRLKDALHQVHNDECPNISPSPPLRRASVALIIRIRPVFPHKPTYDQALLSSSVHTFQESLDGFFSQVWVQHGGPEVLLIKRAARAGDRWTSHIALPGGKRDPVDQNDKATSERETREETGLELDADHSLYIGNLPERIIKTAWDNVPIMVLCPFVYLQMRHDLPPLVLQPTEVHSAHWTPLTGLLSPLLRRDVRCDISERFSRHRTPILRVLLRAIAGRLVFAAVKLKPTESLYSTSILSFIHTDQNQTSLGNLTTRLLNLRKTDEDERPLILWGLTLGIMADLLEIIDGPATSKLWSWPTLSPWDIKFVIWLMNRRYQSRKIRELADMGENPPSQSQNADGARIGGLDNTTYSTSVVRRGKGSEAGVSGMTLITGYTGRLRRAIIIALFLRLAFGTAFSAFLIRKFRRQRT